MCACNVCGKSLEDIKQKAAQDAVAEYQQAHPDPSESKLKDEPQASLAQPEQQAMVDEAQLQELKAQNEQLELDSNIQKRLVKNVFKDLNHLQTSLP